MRFLVLLAALSSIAAKPVTVYVGPATKDGFVSTENKVTESVQHIREELRKELPAGFVLVATENEADVRVILERNTAWTESGYSGSVVSVGNVTSGSVGPNISSYKVIWADVKVGSHSHRLHQAVAGWKKLAKRLSKDIVVWLETNREPIAKHQELRRALLEAWCFAAEVPAQCMAEARGH